MWKKKCAQFLCCFYVYIKCIIVIYLSLKHWHLFLVFLKNVFKLSFILILMSLTWMNVSQWQCNRYSIYNVCEITKTSVEAFFYVLLTAIPNSTLTPSQGVALSHRPIYLLTSCKHQNQQRLGAFCFAQFSFDHTNTPRHADMLYVTPLMLGMPKETSPLFTHTMQPLPRMVKHENDDCAV